MTRLSTRPAALESEVVDFKDALEGSVWRNEFQDLLRLNMPKALREGREEIVFLHSVCRHVISCKPVTTIITLYYITSHHVCLFYSSYVLCYSVIFDILT